MGNGVEQDMSKQVDIEAGQPNAGELIRRLNEEWVEALVTANRAPLDRIMAEDFIFAYPMDGDSKAQFIQDVESGDLRVEYLNRSHVEVNVYGSTAVLMAFDDAKWHYKGRLILGCYKILHVYSFRNELWQLVAIQACPLAK
jgi:meiotically up-regulated gene 157 (Mug157) protein